MFYEEKYMQGVLWKRTHPDGAWVPVGETALSGRVVIAEAANAELFAALQRLLRAIEADVEQCPQMDVLTAFETNSMAIQQAREAIAKYKPA